MSVPAADGHVWKPTETGLQHQFRFDNNAYSADGGLQARCGEQATPVFQQPYCPTCLVQSPATEAANRLERDSVQVFRDGLTHPTSEALRDR